MNPTEAEATKWATQSNKSDLDDGITFSTDCEQEAGNAAVQSPYLRDPERMDRNILNPVKAAAVELPS